MRKTNRRKLVVSVLLVFAGGCGGSHEQLSAPIMEDAAHSHYHVHDVDVAHEHSHDDGTTGGHVHTHQHPAE